MAEPYNPPDQCHSWLSTARAKHRTSGASTNNCCLEWDTHRELCSKTVVHTKHLCPAQTPDGGRAPRHLFWVGVTHLMSGTEAGIESIPKLDVICSRPIFWVQRKGIFQQRMTWIICYIWFKLQDIPWQSTPIHASSECMWKKPPTAPCRLITGVPKVVAISSFPMEMQSELGINYLLCLADILFLK